jgi:hypothetical protein
MLTHLAWRRVQLPARPVWTPPQQWHARVCRPPAQPAWRQRGGRGPAWRLLLPRLLPGGWVSRQPASAAGCRSSPGLLGMHATAQKGDTDSAAAGGLLRKCCQSNATGAAETAAAVRQGSTGAVARTPSHRVQPAHPPGLGSLPPAAVSACPASLPGWLPAASGCPGPGWWSEACASASQTCSGGGRNRHKQGHRGLPPRRAERG